MQITVFKNIFDTHQPLVLDVLAILKRIKDGNSKDLILQIRNEKDEEKQGKLKARLPSICFSGRFSERAANKLLEHSGLICLDIDELKKDDIPKIKEIIEGFDFTFACFISPRGGGIKVIVKIPKDVKNHLGFFNALKQEFDNVLGKFTSTKKNERKYKDKTIPIDKTQGPYLRVNIDTSGKDVSRVCYESWDPDIYWNEDSVEWDVIVENKVERRSVDDDDKIIEKLQKWIDKQEVYAKGNRNNYIYKFASALCRYGIDESRAFSYINVEFEDYPASETKSTVKGAYKANDFGIVEFTQEEMVSTKAPTSVVDTTPVNIFWTINEKGRAKIDTFRFIKFLEAFGFGIYRQRDSVKSWDYIRIQNMIVDVVDVIDIKKIVLKYVREIKAPEQVYDELMMKNRYFEKTFLNGLKEIDIRQVRDTKDTSYIFFEKYYYEINSKTIKRKDYLDLEGQHIWKKQICKKNITELVDFKNHDFNQFVYRSMGSDAAKYKSAITALGYGIHTYKKFSRTKLIYACDESVGELYGMAMGGTGKGLMQQCLEHVRSVTPIDGKDFLSGDRFKFQNVTDDTQIVMIDDYEGDLKELFVKITGHFGVERKAKDRTIIPFSESPKIFTTANVTPKGFSDSYARRFHILEFSDHYNVNNTPGDEFNDRDFFSDDWEQKDFDALYSFLFYCVQMYLKEGLVGSDKAAMTIKVFKKNCTIDFAEFWLDGIDIDVNDWFLGSEVYSKFKDNGDTEMDARTFYGNIRKMAQLFGFGFETKGTGKNKKLRLKGYNFSGDKGDAEEDEEVPF